MPQIANAIDIIAIVLSDYVYAHGSPLNGKDRSLVDLLVDVSHAMGARLDEVAPNWSRGEVVFEEERGHPVLPHGGGVEVRRVPRRRGTLAERAMRGNDVLRWYADYLRDNEIDDLVVDLVADVTLFCDAEELDFDAIKAQVDYLHLDDVLRAIDTPDTDLYRF